MRSSSSTSTSRPATIKRICPTPVAIVAQEATLENVVRILGDLRMHLIDLKEGLHAVTSALEDLADSDQDSAGTEEEELE